MKLKLTNFSINVNIKLIRIHFVLAFDVRLFYLYLNFNICVNIQPQILKDTKKHKEK